MREVSWEEAEAISPGIRADWRHANESPPEPSFRLGGMTEADVRLETDDVRIYVIQLDPEREWYYPPTWVRHPDGGWTAPLPFPQRLWDSMLSWPS